MKKTNGFTLIELLVVFIIVTMLAAILIPAVKRAREQQKYQNTGSNVSSGIKFQETPVKSQTVDQPVRFTWTEKNNLRQQGWPRHVGIGIISDMDTGREFLLIYDRSGNPAFQCVPLNRPTKQQKQQIEIEE